MTLSETVPRVRTLKQELDAANNAWKAFSVDDVLYGGPDVESARVKVNERSSAFHHAVLFDALPDLLLAAEALERVRAWADEPLGTEAQVSALLQQMLGIEEDVANLAAAVSLKSIEDCRADLRQLLPPSGGPK